MEKRKINISSNKDGHGTIGYRVSLPTKWVKEMGFTENNKKAIITFENNKIIIEKESIDMFRNELVEKLFKEFGILIDGKEIWNLIEDDISSNGKGDGFHSIELGKYGNNGELFFAGVEIKIDYDEEDDIYTTDIKLLYIQNDVKTVYVEDLEI